VLCFEFTNSLRSLRRAMKSILGRVLGISLFFMCAVLLTIVTRLVLLCMYRLGTGVNPESTVWGTLFWLVAAPISVILLAILFVVTVSVLHRWLSQQDSDTPVVIRQAFSLFGISNKRRASDSELLRKLHLDIDVSARDESI
ncbi:MAG: hypothetical protein KDB27_32800, partial [Planctomycetales bacterium]|nr:hypothetical protein [Planctomycetales bacterium]